MILSKYKYDILACFVLIITLSIFWTAIVLQIETVPQYSIGEVNAIEQTDLLSAWTWTNYGNYYRYAPLLTLFGKADYYLLAPTLGIDATSPDFLIGARLVIFYVMGFISIALAFYIVVRQTGVDLLPSLTGALLIGVHKGYSYFFYYTSPFATTFLLFFALITVFFWLRYLKKPDFSSLLGYYIFLIICVFTWEQWINLAVGLIICTILIQVLRWEFDKNLILHGIVFPLIVFSIYFILRAPSLSGEIDIVSEAQYVFSYPDAALMLEDIVVNASLHTTSIVESILFPWPTLSVAAMGHYDMNELNAYNKTYSEYSLDHYRFIGDWYAGLIFGVILLLSAHLLAYLRKNPADIPMLGTGIALFYAGFAVHLPVMYRSYFVFPEYVSLLDYKHVISLIGFAILVTWLTDKLSNKLSKQYTKFPVRWVIVFLLCLWILFVNYNKIVIGFSFEKGIYPW